MTVSSSPLMSMSNFFIMTFLLILGSDHWILAVIKNAKYIWLSKDDFDFDSANENCEILIIESYGNKNKADFENTLTLASYTNPIRILEMMV